ncbi:MAG: hypothetical protein PHH24_03405 [Candidatus Moranbacteria bacterium]|jgi:hypothetical protein|nr:hypothetical protein [Candidatus Moranbacteria bacterium]MDD5652180.1 hypothetical protein [Candidatus Moranbacteria bacterium]MDX9855719.1 hypothetical protein [Candidatus Moranbacteria bacterium]
MENLRRCRWYIFFERLGIFGGFFRSRINECRKMFKEKYGIDERDLGLALQIAEEKEKIKNNISFVKFERIPGSISVYFNMSGKARGIFGDYDTIIKFKSLKDFRILPSDPDSLFRISNAVSLLRRDIIVAGNHGSGQEAVSRCLEHFRELIQNPDYSGFYNNYSSVVSDFWVEFRKNGWKMVCLGVNHLSLPKSFPFDEFKKSDKSFGAIR